MKKETYPKEIEETTLKPEVTHVELGPEVKKDWTPQELADMEIGSKLGDLNYEWKKDE